MGEKGGTGTRRLRKVTDARVVGVRGTIEILKSPASGIYSLRLLALFARPRRSGGMLRFKSFDFYGDAGDPLVIV